jgi:hypothetical protein
VAFDDGVERRAEPHEAATDSQRIELEGQDLVAVGGG